MSLSGSKQWFSISNRYKLLAFTFILLALPFQLFENLSFNFSAISKLLLIRVSTDFACLI